MGIVKMKLSELRPARYNPRKELRAGDPAYEKLKNSILTFGNVEPIVWNRLTGNVVGGHQRLTVLTDLGIEESEVSVVELSEVEEKQLNIALNKITGEWDEEKLVILLSDITGEGADATITGFDEKELALLFAELTDGDASGDDFDVEAELQKPPITKAGDVWLLGRHRLICGDSTKKETFDVLMDGKQANLVVTDPPYNVDYEGVAGKLKNDHMASEAFYTFLLSAFQNTEAAMVQDASIYVFHADTEGLNFRRAFADAGFYLSGACIWKKQSIKDPQIVNGTADAEYIVRRLTPSECAMLQGFPSDWCSGLATEQPTDEEIDWWARVFEVYRIATGTSTKPKSRKQIIKWLKHPHTDSAEYKLWGNGVALPCVRFVLAGVAWAASEQEKE